VVSREFIKEKSYMKIYTKTGDAGTTGLFGGPRVAKDDPRICAYGAIDELNAVLGVVRASHLEPQLDQILAPIQDSLFAIGAELATPRPEEHGLKWKAESHVQTLENWIDELESDLSPLRNFILPGGNASAAFLHLARTTCRRVERDVVRLTHDPRISDPSQIVVYLNRLSDLLFVMARIANQRAGIADVPWQSPRQSPNH
jgi:cob(I)alamin adenosyltransferase